MESQYQHTVNGQEVQQADLNMMGEAGALADDRVLAELLRLAPYVAGAAKAIVPFHIDGPDVASWEPNATTVVGSGSADSKVRVNPFRAVVGSRTAIGTDAKKAWRDIRSGLAIGSTTLYQEVQFAATAANHRIDLLYAQVNVDVNAATVSRYVKTAGGSAGASLISVEKRTTVQLGVAQGAEAGSPTRPALPSDSGSAYYIPLAYVHLQHPHTLVTAIDPDWIEEVAPVSMLSRALGAHSIRPPSMCHKIGGIIEPGWAPYRPPLYLPPSMIGGVSLLIPIRTTEMPAGSTHVIDDTIDWRKRIFRWQAQRSSGSFSWLKLGGVDAPSIANATTAKLGLSWMVGFGQSFEDDGTAQAGVAGGMAALLSSANFTDFCATGGDYFALIARDSDGALVARSSNPAPSGGGAVFLWLDASGPDGNPYP